MGRVGRYVILDPIGAGAMGIVYRAYDPELDRDVALKLVRVMRPDGQQERARARLLREAQAMAQLAHPNVVAVYDASIHEAHVFIAMELVEGETLDRWLQRQPRSWREITAAFIEAGRGLAAAHNAGVVHRDVKASNVLVGHDGRIRVSDFGLAGAAIAKPANELTSAGQPRFSTIAGTPAYMSPEVSKNGNGDHRSDQYSLAVALCEAVSGAREVGAGTPAALRGPLRRATAPEARDRFPNMEAFIGKLAKACQPRWRRYWPMIAMAMLAAAVGLGYYVATRPHPMASCAPPAGQLAGIWDAPRRAAMAAAFATTGTPLAPDSARRALQAFDHYAEAWLAAHVEGCRATYQRHEQSPHLLDIQVACLRGELARLRAVTDAFVSAADPYLVERAVAGTELTGGLERCSRLDLLGDERLPSDPGRRASFEQALGELRRIEALGLRGRYAEQVRALAPLLASQPTQLNASLAAEVYRTLGEALWRGGEAEKGAEELYRAVEQAKRAHAIGVEADALYLLAAVIGYELGRHGEGLQLARLGEAAARAIADDGRLGRILSARAAIELAMADYPAAAADYERSRALLETAYGAQDRRVGIAYRNLAAVAAVRDNHVESLELYARALPILENALGSRHPEVAAVLAGGCSGPKPRYAWPCSRNFWGPAVAARGVLAVRARGLCPRRRW